MISPQYLAQWVSAAPWTSMAHVEQDLLLSRAICEIANHPVLGSELVFRGGTAFHKLHLPSAYRYSEDLDYVRTTASGIGEITGALLDMGRALGFDVSSRISMYPKIFWRTTTDSGFPLRLKIEINIHERSPSRPTTKLPLSVASGWWTGSSEVLTFQTEELIATKLRALYQRQKGRDLFDLWLALTVLDIDPQSILDSFAPYRPDRYTGPLSIANLRAKLHNRGFREDIDALTTRSPQSYDLDAAAELVITELLEKIR